MAVAALDAAHGEGLVRFTGVTDKSCASRIRTGAAWNGSISIALYRLPHRLVIEGVEV